MPGKDDEFYLGNSFSLEVDSVALALFTEVSGLESTTDVAEITQQSKDGKTWKKRLPGADANKPGTLTLKTKSVGAAEALWKWRKEIIDGKVSGALRNGSVVIYDNEMKEQGRWNFTNGWPSKLSIGALSAGTNDAVDIELSLEYEQLGPA
ncbi:MAG TPA: phage tail protein [Acidimicrobiia bacterium]|jgi:phage tail-like protein